MSANELPLIRHVGGCHCGRVRFEVDAPAQIEVTECNCSICNKSGFLHLIVTKARFRLLSGSDSLRTYQFNTGTAQHLFCSVCGIKSFYVPRSHPDGYSVNARCLDAGTVTRMIIRQTDGVNWEQSHGGIAMNTATIRARPPRATAAALLDAADLPSADLTDAHMEHFFFCGRPEAPTGLVGIELCGPSALLRSLVVKPDTRATGLGTTLVEHAETHARAHGAKSLYLLTTTAAGFFERRGYVVAARESAPAEIRATREFADICPASSTFMVKHL